MSKIIDFSARLRGGAVGEEQSADPFAPPAPQPFGGSGGGDVPLPLEDEDGLSLTLLRRRPRNLAIDLPPAEREKLVWRIVRDFEDASASNAEFRRDRVQFLRNWLGTPEEASEDGPLGELSANVKVPLTSTMIEQWKAKLTELVLSDGFLTLSSLDPSISREAVMEAQEWFLWELMNVVHLPAAFEEIAHYTLLDGFAVPMPSYVHEERQMCTTREFDLLPLEEIPLTAQIRDAIALLLQNEEIVEITGGKGEYEVTTREAPDRPARVRFRLDGEVLCAEMERVEETFDGVRITVPNVEDVVVLNTHPDIQKIPFYGLRDWLPVPTLRAEARREGLFEGLSEDDLEAIIATAGDKTPVVIPLEITDELDEHEGTDSRDRQVGGSGSSALPKGLDDDEERRYAERYRWEGFINYKGERIGVLVEVAARAQKLLRIEPLEALNKDGLRTPTKFSYIRVPGRFYPMGLGQWLQHLQTEIDGIHNYRLNSGLVSTAPTFFYEPIAGGPRDILRWMPGQGIPTRNAKGVYFPSIPWNPIWGFQEEGLTRKYASEAAGLGDPGLGTFASKRTSATEFEGTLQSIDLRTRHIARGIMDSLRDLLYRILGLYQQHARTGRVYQITGMDGETLVRQISRDRLHGRYLISLDTNLQRLTPQVEQQTAVTMLSLLLNDVLIGMGIVQPDTIHGAIKRVADTMGYKKVILHTPDVPPTSPPPNEEHKAMGRGESVDPHLGENFSEHLTAHTKLASDPRFAELMPDPLAREELGRHIAATTAMAEQVQLMRQAQAEQALAMQQGMESMGVRPGGTGSQKPREGQAKPGSKEEGVGTAPTERGPGTPLDTGGGMV